MYIYIYLIEIIYPILACIRLYRVLGENKNPNPEVEWSTEKKQQQRTSIRDRYRLWEAQSAPNEKQFQIDSEVSKVEPMQTNSRNEMKWNEMERNETQSNESGILSVLCAAHPK